MNGWTDRKGMNVLQGNGRTGREWNVCKRNLEIPKNTILGKLWTEQTQSGEGHVMYEMKEEGSVGRGEGTDEYGTKRGQKGVGDTYRKERYARQDR